MLPLFIHINLISYCIMFYRITFIHVFNIAEICLKHKQKVTQACNLKSCLYCNVLMKKKDKGFQEQKNSKCAIGFRSSCGFADICGIEKVLIQMNILFYVYMLTLELIIICRLRCKMIFHSCLSIADMQCCHHQH